MKRIFIPDPYCKGHLQQKKSCGCHYRPSTPEGMEYFAPKEEYRTLAEWYIEVYLGETNRLMPEIYEDETNSE